MRIIIEFEAIIGAHCIQAVIAMGGNDLNSVDECIVHLTVDAGILLVGQLYGMIARFGERIIDLRAIVRPFLRIGFDQRTIDVELETVIFRRATYGYFTADSVINVEMIPGIYIDAEFKGRGCIMSSHV